MRRAPEEAESIRTVTSLSYCRTGFERLLMAESTLDERRLKERIASWSPKVTSASQRASAPVVREGEVMYYEPIS